MRHTAAISSSATTPNSTWIGRLIERLEDAALPSGRGCFIGGFRIWLRALPAAIPRSSLTHTDSIDRYDNGRNRARRRPVLVDANVGTLTRRVGESS
jgi:hypothetical protein